MASGNPHPTLKGIATQWFYRLRFDEREEVRIAYQVTEEVSEPEMIVTFLVSLQDETGSVTTLLEPVRVGLNSLSGDEKSDREVFFAAIKKPSGNVALETLQRLFADWWQEGRERAKEVAMTRAKSYRQILRSIREEQWKRLQKDLQAWSEEREKAILGEYWQEYQQRRLFGTTTEESLPTPVRKRLQRHREQFRQLRQFWEQWTQVKEPTIEELGILLRVPQKLAGGE
ncbi:MAG: hypothetical protein ACP5LJ_07365 [Candidatus Bipolaricaulaceae bacterium]